MADQAFDAFSQRRSTGTKDRVTERRRVDTYTDPNRYQMPPRRRLGIHAQNKSMLETPQKSNITAFAEGLAEVQPKIMDYLTSQQAAENQKEIQYGIQEAMGTEAMANGDTEFVDNEWRQFGFEQKKAMMAGEEITSQLLIDIENKDPMVDFEPWYQDWYAKKMEENPHLATMNPEHLETYNKPIQKGLTAAKNHALVTKENATQEMYQATATDYIEQTIREAIQYGHEINNELIETIIADEENMSRWGMTKNNEIVLDAISRIAKGKPGERNLAALDYLEMGRGEGGTLPSVASMKPDEVEALRNEVVRLMDADERQEAAAIADIEAEITATTNAAQDHFKRILGAPEDIIDIPGATRSRDRVTEWQAQAMVDYRELVKQLTNNGMPLAQAHDEALKKLEADYKISGRLAPAYTEEMEKDQERKKNSLAYTHDLISQPNYNQISAEVYEGIETQGGFDPKTVIPGWDQLLPEHRTTIIKQGRKTYAAKIAAEVITTAEQTAAVTQSEAEADSQTVRDFNKDLADKTSDAVATANGATAEAQATIDDTFKKDNAQAAAEQDANHAKFTAEQEQIKKANDEKEAKAKEEADAWHQDIDLADKLEDEFDIPQEDRVSVPGYKKHSTDNQGLYTDPNFQPHDPGTFGESIYGQIWEGIVDVGEAIYDIYDTYKGPNSIEVNPMQEGDVTDRDQYNRPKGSRFYGQDPRTNDRVTNNRIAPTSYREAAIGVVANKTPDSISSYLKSDKKLRPEAIAGILGNIDVETGGTFDAAQKQSGGPGYGLFQLEGSKQKSYNKFIANKGMEDSPQSQLEYMYETIYGSLKKEIGYGNAKKLRKIFATGTVEEITTAFEQIWERPGKPHSSRRLKSAKEHYKNLT